MRPILLFFSANPPGTNRIEVDDEYRAIDDEWRRSRLREALDPRCEPAVTVEAARAVAAFRSLRIGGRLVTIGNITPEKVQLNLGYVIASGLTSPFRSS